MRMRHAEADEGGDLLEATIAKGLVEQQRRGHTRPARLARVYRRHRRHCRRGLCAGRERRLRHFVQTLAGDGGALRRRGREQQVAQLCGCLLQLVPAHAPQTWSQAWAWPRACACARTSADTHICARAHTYIYAYTRPALAHRVSRRGAQGQ